MADVVTIVNGRTYLLDDIAHISDLTWSHGWPYGCLEASWSMDLPPNTFPPALMTAPNHDVRVEIWDGPIRVWSGYLTEPNPGDVWDLHALGWYGAFAELLCLTADQSTTSAVPDVVVPAAISRAGLPVTIGTALSSTSVASADETVAVNNVMTLLDTNAEQLGKRWWVDADCVLRLDDDPTSPTLILDNRDALRGAADDNYVTDVYPRFVSAVDPVSGDATAWGLGHVGSASQPAGRRERAMDVTDLGQMTQGTAEGYAAEQLSLNGARKGYTTGLEVKYGDLTKFGGSPRRLGLVRGRDMFRSFNVADASGQVQLGLSVDIIIGKTTYRDGDSTLRVDPLGLVPRTFESALRASRPTQTFEGAPA